MTLKIKVLSWDQAHKCGGIKPVNGIKILPLDHWIVRLK
jgi:hypothetical protein